MTVWAQPNAPKVTRSFPASGATDVDTTLTQITIEFDKDMTSGVSFPGTSMASVDIIDKPFWPTTRKVIIPVKLKGGRLYILRMNGESSNKFQSAGGMPLPATQLVFHTQSRKNELNQKANATAFQEFKAYFLQRYVPLSKNGYNWEAALNSLEPEIIRQKTTGGFATKLIHGLAPADDLDVWVRLGKTLFVTKPPTFKITNYNFEAVNAQLQNLTTSPRRLVVAGTVQDNIGYIRINTWNKTQAVDIAFATAKLKALQHLPYLILDVRGNPGGDDLLAQQFARHFVNKPVAYEKVLLFDEAHKTFTKEITRVLEPAKDFLYKSKVVVLMGPQNAGSCESFLLMMQNSLNAQLIGQRSAGSNGNPVEFKLSNGVGLFLPSGKSFNKAGQSLDKGITPDVELSALPEAYLNEDPLFEKAKVLVKQ
ncbi:hypothetical protein TH63_07735 [Rufibacter radiotolerans]|uniref:Tail specific protease domain-containing protein n=2 Tax=Rufibacter radiotolerans TaxID=1379910 RepID=A0A0H4VPC6_9BACT|nr:hypothetical protein TH63_07735 [Rufibacter radiotolerans]